MRALLLFDDVTFPGFTWTNLDLEEDWLNSERRRYADTTDEREQEYLLEVERQVARDPGQQPHTLMDRAWVRSLANLYVKRGRPVVFLFDQSFGEVLESGNTTAYRAALTGLDLVDEKSLTMEQVEEFRRDPEATRKYRDLRLWLHTGLAARSTAEATDVVGKKLAAYDWAIRKHGLKTITGAIHSILDSRHVAAIAGGAGVSALIASPVWGAVLGGLLVGANVATWIADRAIELEEVKRGPHSEIAIIYEAREQFG